MEISKLTLILTSIILLAIGLFIGNEINEHNEHAKFEVLRATYIYDVRGFIWDFEDDVKKGRMDSVVANYYIHNLGVIYDELSYYPEKYLEWYYKDDDSD